MSVYMPTFDGQQPANFSLTVAPSPGATGPHTVQIGMDTYIVTYDNYSSLARMYMAYRTAQGDDYSSDNQQLATINAFRQIAGLQPTYKSDDGSNPVVDNANKVLNNPFIEVIEDARKTGQTVFTGIKDVTQGVLGTSKQLAEISSFLGQIFGNVGGLIVIGVVGYLVWRKIR
jgi:hypothetical protein